MDGQNVDNIDCVSFYTYTDVDNNKLASMEIGTRVVSKEKGTYSYTRICADKVEKIENEKVDYSNSIASLMKH